ncbi:alcohol dehydrogenase catalytic domain-containing protein [Sinosporangium siamense]|uniref:Alcohol dehydrogenase-like N-terminal domain-containing protein n=1 Tax=Sinosporangium siamense TaxID=1367973 RepID=A0A919RI14_9ACTN|nr:hypothetical protein [Sinosporangium siamense]GII94147.1 hypothetical protein Ssi02_43780 [Sinosporangium siamense]
MGERHAADFLGTMRAARIHEYGEALVISLDEVPVPKPGPDEVLIKVAATSTNPSEAGLRMGLLHDVLGVTLLHTPGWDVAGTVVTGAGDFAPGDRVIGLVALIDKGVVDVEADTRPLESLADLHRDAERGLIRGKVTLIVEK